MTERETVHSFIKTMLETGRLHRKVMEKKLADINCSPSQHRMLMLISMSKKTMTQKDIAEEMNVSYAAVTNIVKRLEESGYIKRKPLQQDCRYNEIKITKEGIKILEETKEIFDRADEEVFSSLTDDEIRAAAKVLDKMKEKMTELTESDGCAADGGKSDK